MLDLNNWGRVAVSTIVTAGFFFILYLIVTNKSQGVSPPEVQLVMLGALGQAFAQVISFWVGSSAGSMKKDEALAKKDEVIQSVAASAAQSPPPPVQKP